MLTGCEDRWTLQASVPTLLQITVCVDVRVVAPGPWVAFYYSSVHTLGPELGLEGDQQVLYGWLLRVRHRFPLRLSLAGWHRLCLRRDVQRHLFSLEVSPRKRGADPANQLLISVWTSQVDGQLVSEQTVIAQAIPKSGSLWLGCRPPGHPSGSTPGGVELYLFRMWEDLRSHGPCEDGTLIGWNTRHWAPPSASPRAWQRDPHLECGETDVLFLGDIGGV